MREVSRAGQGIRKGALFVVSVAAISSMLVLSSCSTPSQNAVEKPSPTTTKSAEEKKPAKPELTALQKEALEYYHQPAPEGFDEWEAMSYEEFIELPPEDRATYVLYMNRDGKIQADQWAKGTGNPAEAGPEDVNPENTAEEIYINGWRAMISGIEGHEMNWSAQAAGEIEADIYPDYNDLQRKKIVAGSFAYPVDNRAVEDWIKVTVDPTIVGATPESYAADVPFLTFNDTVTNRSENYITTDKWGTDHITVDFTVTSENGIEHYVSDILVNTPIGDLWMHIS